MANFPYIFMCSAESQSALDTLIAESINILKAHPNMDPVELSIVTRGGKLDLPFRAACTYTSIESLLEKFEADKYEMRHVDPELGPAKVCFMLTGQGSQYRDMGRGLYQQFPVFKAAVDHAANILSNYLDLPLLEMLYPSGQDAPEDEPLNQTVYTQPALFTLEYALSVLWRFLGITPDALIGHSVGEYAACTIAGVLNLDEGLELISTRARLMQALPAGGTMAAIRATKEEVEPILAAHQDLGCLEISALNGPKQVVVSGTVHAVDALIAGLKAEKIKATKLSVSHAFHCALMDPMLDEFTQVASKLTYSEPTVPLISNLTGEAVTEVNGEYWRNHVRNPVNFTGGMKTIEKMGRTVFLELGPHPVLLAMGSRCIEAGEADKHTWAPSLKRGQNDLEIFAGTLCTLYTLGFKINWSALDI